MTGAPKNILRRILTFQTPQSKPEHLCLEQPEPSDPVNQVAQEIEKLGRRNPEPSIFYPENTLTFHGKLEKNKKFEYFENLFHTTFFYATASH